ncbi:MULTISPECIES: recombinase family protein [Sphingobacterium]|uniref:recombinase family protein n=1 Tax=Sphingobacterium TaxID=28453 RepID=UPI0028A74301|nr:recombinase family protein [Sphingobacterium multivorum]
MTSAIIYIRVSTDEQAQKGYSQRSQEEKLNKYCKDNHIEIIQTVFEDHSAKNFERPAWTIMMKQLNINKSNRPQLILFTRWDRFSRNTANAYYMISQLQKLGIEPQASDQPLDMSVPENKVLLAMYIVTAEVENDRRSLNIKQGIHKAKKEGRYMGRAPIGYINISLPDGTKTIVPREPEATLIKNVFQDFDENISVRSYYKTILKSGLKCSLNAFFNILQNPVYCGKIRVPSLDGRTIVEVQGIHNPLISIELFDDVQSRIKRRNKKYIKQSANSELMFRGILSCPVCSKKISGSGSKGRTKKYFYYHCSSSCGYRIRADKVNKNLLSGISLLKPNVKYTPIFEDLIKKIYGKLYEQKSIDKTNVNRSLHKMIERVANARELLVKGTIDEEDYHSIKSDCENRIGILGTQLNDAYKLDVQQKQSLKKLTKCFLKPALIFRGTDNSIELKLASLFLNKDFVYSDADFTSHLKDEVRIVYVSQYSNTKENFEEAEVIKNISKEQQEIISNII